MVQDPAFRRSRGINGLYEYGYIVARNGRVWQVAPDEAITGHSNNDEINVTHIGISVDGNFHQGDGLWAEKLPDVQFNALVGLIIKLKNKYKIPIEEIKRHRDVFPTACPGNQFPWLKLIREIRLKNAQVYRFTIRSKKVEVKDNYDKTYLEVPIVQPAFLQNGIGYIHGSSLVSVGFANPWKLANKNGNVAFRDIHKMYASFLRLDWDAYNKRITIASWQSTDLKIPISPINITQNIVR